MFLFYKHIMSVIPSVIPFNSLNYPCYSCKPCKNRGYKTCDGCDASCCIKCINEHKNLMELLSNFRSEVDRAEEEAKEKTNSLDNELRGKDIYVSWTSDIKDYLENMREKKSDIINEYSNFNTNEVRNEYERKFLQIRNHHELDNLRIERDFNERKRDLERQMENIRYSHNINMNSKRNDKNNLQNKLNQTKSNNQTKKVEALNKFKVQLKQNAENNYIQQKNRIDTDPKYQKEEKKFECSEEEKKKMEQYFTEINKIYEYSKIVPQDLINNLLN